MPKISDEQKIDLIKSFSLDEIKEVVFSLKHDSAPGPDGIPSECCQHFWDLVKSDLKGLFDDFIRVLCLLID